MNSFAIVDWIVLGGFFVLLFGVVVWIVRQRKEDTTDYFLAGKNVGWFAIGASIFASNIGSEHLVGLAGAGASSGVVFGHFELTGWMILLLGWVFLPFYLRSGVFTMPGFLEKRYSSSSRWFLSLISLISYILTKVSVTVYAGGIVLEAVLGINFWTGAIIVVVATGLYTIFGGMKAVLYTSIIQTPILVIGSLLVTAIGLIKLGGWNNMVEIVGPEKLDMFKPVTDPDYPWTGMVFGVPVVGLWYWCTDQYIVQRTLTARNETQARRGTIFAAYLKMLPLFIFIIPGLIAFALSEKGIIQLDSADQAFPTLVRELLPVGIKGLVIGGLFAALMSSLSSLFNSCSVLFTVDFYKKYKPASSERHLVKVGQIATAIVVVLGIAWIPTMKLIADVLYEYLQKVQTLIGPSIAAVFLLGIFFKRITEKGAFIGLVSGFVIGMTRLGLSMAEDRLNPEGILYDFVSINWLHFCIFLFLFCIFLIVIISFSTRKPDEEKIKGLTYRSLTREHREATFKSWNYIDVVHTVVIVALTITIFIVFS
ncbi:MAG: sodium/solute symporter [Bacteroidales bacterium]|nr:sodium/solute symporter [Bacteroidales bacterium]